MKGIIEAQSPTVNDTCTDCGSFVDIGAVIDEHDTLLTLNFVGDSAQTDRKSWPQDQSDEPFETLQSHL